MDEWERTDLCSDLHVCVASDPSTGALRWRPRLRRQFMEALNPHQACRSWNARNAGAPAFETIVGGIKKGRFKNKWLCAHIIVWTLSNGRYPEAHEEIIHVNGDKLDNRLENLQCMSRTDNLSQYRDIPSSVECVTRGGKERYRARYYSFGHRFVTGLHDDWVDAVRQAEHRQKEQEQSMRNRRAVIMYGQGKKTYRPFDFDGNVLKESYDTPGEATSVVTEQADKETDIWSN